MPIVTDAQVPKPLFFVVSHMETDLVAGKGFTYIYMVTTKGLGVIVVHGNGNGFIDSEGADKIRYYGDRIDEIYCCSSAAVRQIVNDPRIKGGFEGLVEVSVTKPSSNGIQIVLLSPV